MENKLEKIIALFRQVSRIPRCSGNEARIADWLGRWADQRGFEHACDRTGNLLIRIPASAGYETAKGIVLQGHMDMVCEKTADADHDFSKDPIQLVVDGDWLRAEKTTLGADNGIAIALGLALAEDETVLHPPLELLFTVDEESGLTGASGLAREWLTGQMLVNIDSEDEGVFTIGCAGGRHTTITLPLNRSEIPPSDRVCRVQAHGMAGGHSGVDIHTHRANAIKIMARTLEQLIRTAGVRLITVSGGTTHNAIPRRAEAVIACDPADAAKLQAAVARFQETVQGEYASVEPAIELSFAEDQSGAFDRLAVSEQDTRKIVGLMLALPSGVAELSADLEDLVETSSNLARIETTAEGMRLLSSQRSLVMSRLDEITAQIEAVAALAGAAADSDGGYPAWLPSLESPLLKKCRDTYRSLFGREPKVTSIHAGLECGIIGAKYEGMDMISLGPDIRNPHSPGERLYLPSVEKVWTFLVALLADASA